MKHGAKSGRKGSKENDPNVAPADDLFVGGRLVEVLPVDIEAKNRTDCNDLRRHSGCRCHECH